MSRTHAPGAVEVRDEPLSSPVAQALIAALNAELRALYPPDECFHDLAADEVAPGQGRFLVAWEGAVPVGCGALRRLDDGRAEVKRMFVVPERRGRGISRAVLGALEATARELGVRSIVLETGVHQPPAIGLYESAGYVRIPAFGQYVTSASSVCMERQLDQLHER